MLRMVAFSFRAMYPSTPQLPGLDHAHSTEMAQRIFVEASPTFRLGIVLGSLVFVLTPVLTLGLPLPAFLLSPEKLDLHAQRITSHRFYLVRQAIVLVKLGGGMAWATQPRVRDRLSLPALPPDPGTWRAAHPGPTP